AHRPQHGRVAGAVLARQAVHAWRVELTALLDQEAFRELSAGGVHLELHDGERGDRGEVVRVEDAEQRLGQLGGLVVELVVQAAGEQGEGLEHALDLRVGAAVGLQQQAARGPRVLAGELQGELPDEKQLALVVGEEGFAHYRIRKSEYLNSKFETISKS